MSVLRSFGTTLGWSEEIPRDEFAVQIREKRLEAARRQSGWTELEEVDLVPRDRGLLVSAITDEVFKPYAGVVFATSSVEVLSRVAKHRIPPRENLPTAANSRTGGIRGLVYSDARGSSSLLISAPTPTFSTTQNRSSRWTMRSTSGAMCPAPGATMKRVGFARIASYSSIDTRIGSEHVASPHSHVQSGKGGFTQTCRAFTAFDCSFRSRNRFSFAAIRIASASSRVIARASIT